MSGNAWDEAWNWDGFSTVISDAKAAATEDGLGHTLVYMTRDMAEQLVSQHSRLRSALERIASFQPGKSAETWQDDVYGLRDIAREALEGDTK